MRWAVDRLFLLVPAQAYVGQFLATFKDYPQRQKVAELYELWWEHHGDAPTKASELRANPLRTTPLRRKQAWMSASCASIACAAARRASRRSVNHPITLSVSSVEM